MSEEERFILANIEALTQDEGTGVAYCNIVKEFAPPEEYEWFMPCDSKTSGSMIYPCLKDQVRQGMGKQDRCTTK